ncbi:hypothetical protein HOLleu_16414 [Holothuria leucospilota]|uniref:Tyr recombinase domain-containing protein n=1 Tax=Holothuria leucospilota TaxID=206669 RepID=A0A9Q1C649_HOLLE|nr:hypothetical protein HOLleu_16414 [Holothuria leucospilota]
MWGSYFFYAFPPFSLIGKSLQKVEQDQATGIFIAPLWATQTWFVKLMELLIDQPKAHSMSHYREALRQQGISEQAIEIILSAWRPSTQRQYASSFSRWFLFCREKDCSPFITTIPLILDFLTSLYNAGNGYSNINTARSMLSSFLICPHQIGKNYLIKRFMKGIFELRTPVPRYKTIWDVSIVLDYLRLLGETNTLPLKLLTYKVVTLIALISAQRCQTLGLLNLNSMEKKSDMFIFYLSDKVKQSRPGNVGLVVYTKFPGNELCAFTALERYLHLTKSLRKDSKLFISFVRPHASVSRETISRWIKYVLKESGLNTDLFKPHSTRSAATSGAFVRGVPVEDILQTAGWSNELSFVRFYQKPITDLKDNKFVESILTS